MKNEPKISVEYEKNATIAIFTDTSILEDEDIQAIQNSIMPLISQSGPVNLILDFSNVKFLTSAMLGVLIRLSRKIYEAKGQLKLCSIDPKVQQIFKITRLTRVFDICLTKADALTALEN